MRLRISSTAEHHLDQWANALITGELHLGELPLAVEQFVWIGQLETRRLTREYEQRLDLAYLQAYSPKDRAAEYMRRLQQHFTEEDHQFFTTETRPHERRAA